MRDPWNIFDPDANPLHKEGCMVFVSDLVLGVAKLEGKQSGIGTTLTVQDIMDMPIMIANETTDGSVKARFVWGVFVGLVPHPETGKMANVLTLSLVQPDELPSVAGKARSN